MRILLNNETSPTGQRLRYFISYDVIVENQTVFVPGNGSVVLDGPISDQKVIEWLQKEVLLDIRKEGYPRAMMIVIRNWRLFDPPVLP